ncbi:tyrosine-type recombinase/integrase [Lysinibacillus sp. FSL P2-0066]|uniref:tyrosine-type recombinase/integrase n=1 Tax=Lysinibacillus sp. FSL P2-0066 TaxID=2921720 RepID=UPI0030DB74DE
MPRKVKELRMDDVVFKPNLKPSLSEKKDTIQKTDSILIEQAIEIVNQQMKLQGLRHKTLLVYNHTMQKYVEFLNLKTVDDINKEGFMDWLESLNHLDKVTQANRFRFVSAVLTRFYDNGWIKGNKFWKDIKIKVDKKVKQAAQEKELEILLSVIDATNFIGFRDLVVVLLLYRTGIRINTLASLKEEHIHFSEKMLVLSGDIMKNHRVLKLPLDDELLALLKRLIQQNEEVRKRYKEKNDYVFITKSGKSTLNSYAHNNAISKRLYHYAKKYGLKSVKPHNIRRTYATNLNRKGVNIAVISKALGHSSLVVTERYLEVNVDEVADTLRKYL